MDKINNLEEVETINPGPSLRNKLHPSEDNLYRLTDKEVSDLQKLKEVENFDKVVKQYYSGNENNGEINEDKIKVQGEFVVENLTEEEKKELINELEKSFKEENLEIIENKEKIIDSYKEQLEVLSEVQEDLSIAYENCEIGYDEYIKGMCDTNDRIMAILENLKIESRYVPF